MSVVANVEEGSELVDQLVKFDECSPSLVAQHFRRLYFRVDVRAGILRDVEKFIDDFADLDEDINLFCENGLIDFDYFITLDLLPEIKFLISTYEEKKFSLVFWELSDGSEFRYMKIKR